MLFFFFTEYDKRPADFCYINKVGANILMPSSSILRNVLKGLPVVSHTYTTDEKYPGVLI